MPSSVFAKALQIMEHAWEDNFHAKSNVNSMIGLLARDVSQTYNVKSSSQEIDGAGHDYRQLFAFGEDQHLWDYAFRQVTGPSTSKDIAAHACLGP